MIDARDRLIVALDVETLERAGRLVEALRANVRIFKVGLELFTSAGRDAVEAIRGEGVDVFLDLKLHDIPRTVERAAAAAARLGVRMTTVHSLGGRDVVAAAREGLEKAASPGGERPLLLAVTLLTSHGSEDMKALFPGDWTLEEKVRELAAMAGGAGADGVVCSPREVGAVKRVWPGALAVTPGVRPVEIAGDDQRRTATPASAIEGGADYLVLGRPVRGAPDPAAAAACVIEEMQAAFERR